VRDIVPGTMFSSRFQFFAPFVELVEKGINFETKDVFYNYTNVSSMTRSHIGWAFKVGKEFHVITLQVFIDVCSPPNFVVMDPNYETCTYIHPFLIILDSKLILQSYRL